MFPTEKKIKSYFSKQKLWGLITYQPRWGLTGKGWFSIIMWLLAMIVFLILNLHPFLAPSAPVATAKALVIEGWIADDGVQGAIAEFHQHNYQVLMTVGTPITRGGYLTEYHNFAELSAATAIKLGFDSSKLAIIPSPPAERDRTFTSAIAVKQWLKQNYPQITAINLYSHNVHSRRSWLLYKRALQPDMQVGIIAHPPLDYDARWWWKSSEGVREVIGEAIAYIYAKFFS